MMDYSPLASLGLKPEEGRLASNGKNMTFNCHKCVERGEPTKDTKHRLHVCVDPGSKRFGAFHCFRCSFSGRVKKGSVELDLSYLKRKSMVELLSKPVIEDAVLPSDFSPIQPCMYAKEYLEGRGLNENDINYYDVGVARGRIFFPDYDVSGNLVYWVARSYDGTAPKYLNSPTKRDDKIYNLGRYIRDGKFDTLTICEGAISAIAAGRDSIATYGKLLSMKQVEIIKKIPAKKVYVALDPDAKREAIKLAKDIMNSFPEVYLVPMPKGQDPASLGREKFLDIKRRRSMLFTESSRDVPVRFLLEG